MSKLAGSSLDENGKNIPRGHFQELTSKYASEQWKADGTVSKKYVGSNMLCFDRGSQPSPRG